MESDIETTIALAKIHDPLHYAQAAPGTWPKASDEADGTGRPQPGFFRMHRPGYFSLVAGLSIIGRI